MYGCTSCCEVTHLKMAIPVQKFPYPFPGNGFNTGTITVTLQISLRYSTHKIFK
jgi:hypothetical protein